jgi:hypothetical protein
MRRTRRNAWQRTPRVLLGILLIALLLAALGAVAAATADQASGRGLARPGRPAAKSPSGTIESAKPLFAWSKAARATRYEVRVYRSGTLLLTKTGIAKLSWRCDAALDKNVAFTWKVRARNARGNGAWSASRRFKVALAIGDAYGGGRVAYILKSGDPGYVAGETHGLIAATADQTPTAPWNTAWSNITDTLIGATAQGLALGTGRTNTAAIVAQTLGNETIGYVYCTAGAAFICDNLVEGGYSDWYLPSKDELDKLYLMYMKYANEGASGNFNPSGYYQAYWSSSESAGLGGLVLAWYQYFNNDPGAGADLQNTTYKTQTYSVRAVRSF